MKKLMTLLVFIILSSFFFNTYAYEIKKDEKIYASGETIGIRLETGVKVMGTYGVNVKDNVITPWANCDIKEGDIIVKYNNNDITNIKSLLKAITNSEGNTSDISVSRNGKVVISKIKPALKDNDTLSLGLYIKDYISGIGTLTYIVPGANVYGSLGHAITDDMSYGGNIFEATVDKIIKPTKQQAGEKRASIKDASMGDIKYNAITGVHGNLDEEYEYDKSYSYLVANKNEVKKGKAYILTCINDNEVKKFDIEITEVKKQPSKDVKGIRFKVTDKELIKESGGIVQGMSGSPIIQNDKIIGAVTHVTLNDAKVGYGIYIEFMLEEMGVTLEK